MLDLRTRMRKEKRRIVMQALIETNMNACAAARGLAIHRNTIDRLCRELDIDLCETRRNYQQIRRIA
jgi:transcriptional regulator with GAF, ATPase, and Fis domain